MDTQIVKKFVVPALVFVLGFGLMTGCSQKKSNSSEEGVNSDSMSASVNEQRMNDSWTYTADLEGESETPGVTTDASGDVTITLNDDGTIQIEGEFSGLSSAYTASHIHMGAKGEAGKVVQPLDPTINDDNMSGSFDETYTLNDSLVTALKNGMLYVNVHSEQHPDGEIRGQLTSDEDSGSMDDNY